eukprot:gene9291-biopygen1663
MQFHSVLWCRRRYLCTFQLFAIEISARQQYGTSDVGPGGVSSAADGRCPEWPAPAAPHFHHFPFLLFGGACGAAPRTFFLASVRTVSLAFPPVCIDERCAMAGADACPGVRDMHYVPAQGSSRSAHGIRSAATVDSLPPEFASSDCKQADGDMDPSCCPVDISCVARTLCSTLSGG